MNLQVKIDQRAALAAGIDAPHSTARVEFFPDRVHDPDILKMVADHLDFRTGEIKLPGDPNNRLVYTKPPSHEQLLEGLRDMMWRFAATPQAHASLRDRYQDAQEATWRVLRDRKTKSAWQWVQVSRGEDGKIQRQLVGFLHLAGEEKDHEVLLSAGTLRPDWPADALPSIVDSEEAEAWLSELEESNQRAKLEAFVQAERQLVEKEQHLARLRAEEEAAAAERIAKSEATRQQLTKWVQKHGTAMQKERLRRGWLTIDSLIVIVLEHAFQDFLQPVIEIRYSVGRIDGWLRSSVESDEEMQAVVTLERDLKKAGMDQIGVEVLESESLGKGHPERVLRAVFSWPKHDLEGISCHCAMEGRTEEQVAQSKATRSLLKLVKKPTGAAA